MAARALVALLLSVLSWPVFAQSFYVSGEPPANWRPGSNYSDGVARVLVGKFGGGGIHQTGGLSMMIGPLTIREGGWQVLTQADPYPDDPVKSLLWKLSPGSEAQAFVPAAIYGAGIVSNTVFRFGARQVVSSAFLKFATGAGKDMARQTFRGAAVGTIAMVLAGMGLNWVWDQVNQRWVKPDEAAVVSDGYLWTVAGAGGNFTTKQAACAALRANWNAKAWADGGTVCRIQYQDGTWSSFQYQQKGASTCPAGWYVTPAGCLQHPSYQPVEELDFEQRIKSIPWPDDLPEQLPEGVPVEQPVINPLPSPWDKPKPLFSPVGDPVKNPNYDPTKEPSTENPPKIQPGREIKGSPTVSDPWRVSVIPVDKPIVSPGDEDATTPKPDPTLDPEDPANPDPESPNKPSEDQPLLCEVFPNISACQVLGGPPEAQDIQNRDMPIVHTPVAGFGPSDGACPPPRQMVLAGFGTYELKWDKVCYVASGVRPIVIALAWFSAGFLIFRLR